ncbi:hypothetical protein [Rheinheimera sp.]|uniref:hypothetical protein n=1 Tax=Rheinheimera sp. TaxID=1869214 RepID=UPI0040486095
MEIQIISPSIYKPSMFANVTFPLTVNAEKPTAAGSLVGWYVVKGAELARVGCSVYEELYSSDFEFPAQDVNL